MRTTTYAGQRKDGQGACLYHDSVDPNGDNGDGLSSHALEVPQSPQVLREVDRDGGELDPVSFSGVSAKTARRVQTLHSIQKMVGQLAVLDFFFTQRVDDDDMPVSKFSFQHAFLLPYARCLGLFRPFLSPREMRIVRGSRVWQPGHEEF